MSHVSFSGGGGGGGGGRAHLSRIKEAKGMQDYASRWSWSS